MHKKIILIIGSVLIILIVAWLYSSIRGSNSENKIWTEQERAELLEDLSRSASAEDVIVPPEADKRALLESLSEQKVVSPSTPSVSDEEKKKILEALERSGQ